MIYYITRYTGNAKDAGTKAPNDIEAICKKNGWKEIRFINPSDNKKTLIEKVKKIVININNWKNLSKIVSRGDFVLYQHPMYFGTKFANKYIPIFQKKGVKFVALIHDLESLRNLVAVSEESKKSHVFGDLILLKKFDYIIAHNQKMKDYLIHKGIDGKRIVCLEIFDYLCQTEFKTFKKTNSVNIAGNLDPNKCGYIYEFIKDNPELKVELFGGNYVKNKVAPNLVYRGSFLPEEITGILDGAFGIVWDGPTSKSCAGNTGNYLRYNNPHKTSMYLAAGIPVIVWEEAAIAQFIIENKVGITIKSLESLTNELNKVSEIEYNIMARNARNIGTLLRQGAYFQNAMERILVLDVGEKINE